MKELHDAVVLSGMTVPQRVTLLSYSAKVYRGWWRRQCQGLRQRCQLRPLVGRKQHIMYIIVTKMDGATLFAGDRCRRTIGRDRPPASSISWSIRYTHNAHSQFGGSCCNNELVGIFVNPHTLYPFLVHLHMRRLPRRMCNKR